MLASVVTRASEPGSKQGISRDWVTLLLKATYLSSVPSKMGNLKLLWGAGTLVADDAGDVSGGECGRRGNRGFRNGGEGATARR